MIGSIVTNFRTIVGEHLYTRCTTKCFSALLASLSLFLSIALLLHLLNLKSECVTHQMSRQIYAKRFMNMMTLYRCTESCKLSILNDRISQYSVSIHRKQSFHTFNQICHKEIDLIKLPCKIVSQKSQSFEAFFTSRTAPHYT